MAAAVRDTGEGPVVVNPFDPTRPEDAETIQHAEAELQKIARKGWADLKRQLFDDGNDDKSGQVR
jgi:hypothetical protein